MLVQELQDIEEFFTGDIARIASDISARMSSALTSKRDEQRIMADLQATLKSSEDARKALEMQLSFLAKQQEEQQRQIERLEEERLTAEAKAQEDKNALKRTYEAQLQRLEEQTKSASHEEKAKLQEEMAKLQQDLEGKLQVAARQVRREEGGGGASCNTLSKQGVHAWGGKMDGSI